MARKSGLLTRSGAYLGAIAAQLVGTFAILPVLTRALSADQYGSAVTALVIGQVLTFVVAAGMPVAILRTYLESPQGGQLASRVVGGAVVVSTGISIALLSTLPLWGPLVTAGEDARRLLPLAVLIGWTQGLLEIGLAILRAAERPKPFVLASLIRSLAGPLIGLGFVAVGGRSAGWYLAGLLLASSMSAVLALVLGGVRPPDRAGWAKLRSELPVALPGIPHGLGMMALAVGDRLVIERMLGTSDAGRYHVAYLFGTLGVVVVQAINNVWAPLVVGASEDTRWELHRKVTAIMVVAVGAVSAGAALLAPAILAIALPTELRSSELVLVTGLVSTGAILFVLYAAGGHVLTSVGWTAPLVVVTPAVAALNILANLVAVPRWGLAGAGVTTAVSYGLLALTVAWVSSRKVPLEWPWVTLLAWASASTAIAVVGTQVPDGTPWWLARTASAGALAVIAGLRILRTPEIAFWFKGVASPHSTPPMRPAETQG